MGNICRSPIAEGIMQALINKNKLFAEVDSAGTINHHAGENPDHRAIKKAKQHGIDISKLIARPFRYADFAIFDLIYVMDAQNYRALQLLAKNDSQMSKVKFIMDEVYPDSHIEVPDPYFGGDAGFESVFQMIKTACEEIEKKLNYAS